MKILIAEDDPAYRHLLEAGLHHDARQLMIVAGIFSVSSFYQGISPPAWPPLTSTSLTPAKKWTA